MNLYKYNISRSEWEKLIDEWVFKERDRKMMKRRLLDGLTFEQLAEEFECSTQNVCRIIYKNIDYLSKKI